MTLQEFQDRMVSLRNQWSDASNNESDPNTLLGICESFIDGMETAFELAMSPGHPPPPPPRIRP